MLKSKPNLGVILLLALALLFGFTTVASAATTTGVSGTVQDIDTGAAIAGAAIAIGNTSATTDSLGNYTINSKAGNVTLQASASGYATTWQIGTVNSGAVTTINFKLTKAYGSQAIPAANMNYTVLAWNDLGMHCDQDDYSYFSVLPPYNTLHVQIKNRNNTVGMITSGVTVAYNFPKKTNSTLHTNFWTYAPQYGWNVPANTGISGTQLSGTMQVDAKNLGFVAQGIPITPYDDDGTWDPYGAANITVTDSSNTVLQTASVVAPVSTEMNCKNCHGSATVNPQLDILQKHDSHNGTTLAADQANGKVHSCSECHSDNALGAPGQAGVESLSLAMHNFHKDKMTYTTAAANTTPTCYNCHPGPNTQCLRGVMDKAGVSCENCHGDMNGIATSLQSGRQAWVQEPKCGTCHDAKHQENTNTLYRNSIFNNSPVGTMNNELYCEACHNSTHGEFTTTNSADLTIPQKFQGDSYWIWNCDVCHTNKNQGQMHR